MTPGPQFSKHYKSGYRSGQDATPEKITRADARKAPSDWYRGFWHAEAGHPMGGPVDEPE